MAKPFIVIGAGGHGAVITDILYRCGHSVKGFLDDAVEAGTEVLGVKVLGKLDECKFYNECMFIIGVGDNGIRKRIAQTYSLEYGTAVHPSAVIGGQASIGTGSVVMAGSVINVRTVIGNHCIVNTSASVDHDGSVGDFVHIAPSAALGGGVLVGEGTFIGIGACVKNNVSVCGDVVVGAGAVVVRDIVKPGVYVGVPAGNVWSV